MYWSRVGVKNEAGNKSVGMGRSVSEGMED
jgi:hypothetical protein